VAVGTGEAVAVAEGGGVGVPVGISVPQAESSRLRVRIMAQRMQRIDFKAMSPGSERSVSKVETGYFYHVKYN
jgi:hypothetical protein